MDTETISIIMPVLNEAKYLRDTLTDLCLGNKEELIIVDGGSTDDTVSIAREFTDNVFTTETGRARVMNYGAKKAKGEIFLFLHADCTLPDNAFQVIRQTMKDNSTVAGAFYLSIACPGLGYRIIEISANLRHRITSLLYGDQGIFLKRKVFEQVGGYADIPLMEDIEISRKLKKLGKIVFVNPPIKASPRRWINEGPLYTTMRDWTIAFSYSFLKASPDKLIRYYKNIR